MDITKYLYVTLKPEHKENYNFIEYRMLTGDGAKKTFVHFTGQSITYLFISTQVLGGSQKQGKLITKRICIVTLYFFDFIYFPFTFGNFSAS